MRVATFWSSLEVKRIETSQYRSFMGVPSDIGTEVMMNVTPRRPVAVIIDKLSCKIALKLDNLQGIPQPADTQTASTERTAARNRVKYLPRAFLR
jgi:hypothetical protein